MYPITIQFAVDKTLAPSKSLIRKWARAALSKNNTAAELTIRIVDSSEMTHLNSTYRHKNGPTNVLSFPLHLPEDIKMAAPSLGDIVICAEVVNREAAQQHKTETAHWAHMVIHGVFHLLGYDHETDAEALTMESLEIETLLGLGFANPYESGEDRLS